jgi:histidinol-phosphate aminotransferase
MRLGYLVAPAPLTLELRKMVPPFHLSLFAAVLGQVLWERNDLFGARVQEIIAERERLMGTLRSVEGVEVFPSHANFILLRVENPERLFTKLKDAGILVRALGTDPALLGCLRVNVGTTIENDRFLDTVKSVMR